MIGEKNKQAGLGGLFRPHRTPLKVNMGFGGCVCAIWSIELLYEVFRRILRSTMNEGSCTNCATHKGKKRFNNLLVSVYYFPVKKTNILSRLLICEEAKGKLNGSFFLSFSL